MSFLPSNSKGPFLPTSQVFPEEISQRLIVLTDNYTQFAQYINEREIGAYDTVEQLTGKQFFNTTNPEKKRFSYRKVFSLGAIAAGASLVTAHGISGVNSTTLFTQIYGSAFTAVPDNRPIPYASVTAVNRQIEINIDATNITLVNGGAAPNITSAIVVVEYLKN